MHLVNDVHTVFSDLWRNPDQFNEISNIVDVVVRCGIQFMDVIGSAFLKSLTRFALMAGFSFCCRIIAIDGFSKNPGTGGFANSPGSTEEVCMCQLLVFDGILSSPGDGVLTDHRIEGIGAIFSGADQELMFHTCFL